MNFDEIRRAVGEDLLWNYSDDEVRRLVQDAYQSAIDRYLRELEQAERAARRERVLYMLRNDLFIRGG